MRWMAALVCAAVPLAAAGLRVGTFRADATPDAGEPLIWVTPAKQVLDPLLAKGVVIEDGRARYVLCALDWCGLGGSTNLLLRTRMAKAAGTDVSRVMIQTVHQHTAPYIDGDAYAADGTPRFAAAAHERRVHRAPGGPSRQSCPRRRRPPGTVRYRGTGSAAVEQVASQRRMFQDGKLVTRFSGGAKDPAMAAMPEGFIDPQIRTVTLARGKRPLARLALLRHPPADVLLRRARDGGLRRRRARSRRGERKGL